ncbi:MAG: hypothetical protein AB1576_00075 [Bacillota bacterium]
MIHVHTVHSGDSSATLEHIDSSALWGRAVFVIVTDHDTMEMKDQEGWRGHYLLLVGEEVSPRRGDHYLALRVREPIASSLGPQEVIDEVKRQGGLGFIEHPHFQGNLAFGASESPWRDWSVKGFNGMSIFNFTTDWGVRLTHFKFLLFRVFPFLAVDMPNPKTIQQWDLLNRERRVVGIGTMDAHRWVKRIRGKDVEAHPFRYCFRSVRTHVLLPSGFTGDVQRDAGMIYEALEQGRCYVANDYLRDSQGFRFSTASGDPMGSVTTAPARFEVTVPAWGRIRLLRDGLPIATAWGRSLTFNAGEAGAYRVEVSTWHRYRLKPWVFSNPIYVRPRNFGDTPSS